MDELRRGMVGPHVAFLQTALRRAGYEPGGNDGIFGDRTEFALMRFQSAHGLRPDGIAGSDTHAALTPYYTGVLSYTAVRGDTLYRIARRYGAAVAQVEAANPGIAAKRLEPGQVLTVPLPFRVVPTDIPMTYAVLTSVLKGLAARYPFLRTSVLGQSVMQRPIPVITIGGGATEVSYSASHHANEWITTVILLHFLEDYAAAVSAGQTLYGQNSGALYARTRLHLVPMVNPDGVDLVTGALRSGLYYEDAGQIAAQYPDIPFPDGWKANIAGRDLNLSYPAGWAEAQRIKHAQGFTKPAPRDFVGNAPLDAPESLALHTYTVRHAFALILAYHTQGEVIYWKYLDKNPPRAADIGARFASASGYFLEDTPYASGFAGYKDWFIDAYNRPGYTIEAGLGDNPLPIAMFDEIYRKNTELLTLGLALA